MYRVYNPVNDQKRAKQGGTTPLEYSCIHLIVLTVLGLAELYTADVSKS